VLDTIFAVLIILIILGLCFLMMYWGVTQIYKSLKLTTNSDTELIKELYSLKQRVEVLESKLSNRLR
jgi:hypothetical protein